MNGTLAPVTTVLPPTCALAVTTNATSTLQPDASADWDVLKVQPDATADTAKVRLDSEPTLHDGPGSGAVISV